MTRASVEKDAFLPLSTGPYRDFESGRKSVEIRRFRKQWLLREGRGIVLSRGYSTPDRLRGRVGRVVSSPDWVSLPEWAKHGSNVEDPFQSQFFEASEPLVAIEVLDITPVQA